jgi:hypothetical protein
MGLTYGGHGGTLGPALTFGWLSGADAAQLANTWLSCPNRAIARGRRHTINPGRPVDTTDRMVVVPGITRLGREQGRE